MSTSKLSQMVRDSLAIIPPIHPKGWPFVCIAIIVAFIFCLLSEALGAIGILATLYVAYFFRDPKRSVPQRKNLIVAPADGKVCQITEVHLPPELEHADTSASVTRVSIFLSVFDVHVQRVPIAGNVIETSYNPGKYLSASLDKASDENERSTTLLELEDGRQIVVVQIAGFIARRIVNELEEGQSVKTGERYGIIRFGSRVDIYLPQGVDPLVTTGQTMSGGETIIADLDSKEDARIGQEI